MNRLPWVLGIILALVAGLAIGYVAAASRPLPPQRPEDLPEHPLAPLRFQPVESKEEMLEDEILDLKRELLKKTKEAEDAKAALAARPMPAPTEPTLPDPVAPGQAAPLEEARTLFEEIAALDVQGMFGTDTQEKREKVQDALNGAGDAAYAFLEEMLASDDSGKRFLAVVYLGELDRVKALPLMRKALADTRDDLVRRMASHTLATKKVKEALPDLMRAMKEDKDWGVRVNSAYGAAKMGEKTAIPALVKAYEDPAHSPIERYQVLAGVADVADDSTAPLFRDLLSTSKDDSTLFLAIGVVQKLNDKSSLAPLQAIIQGSGSSLIKDPAKKAYNAIYGQEVYR